MGEHGQVDASDRREFTRVPAWLVVELETEDGRVLTGQARYIGLRGAFVRSAEKLPLGAECEVNLLLGESPGDPRMFARGRVVRHEATGMALEFSEVELESFQHLQRFILYNADDPSLVEEEFDAHTGISRKAS